MSQQPPYCQHCGAPQTFWRELLGSARILLPFAVWVISEQVLFWTIVVPLGLQYDSFSLFWTIPLPLAIAAPFYFLGLEWQRRDQRKYWFPDPTKKTHWTY